MATDVKKLLDLIAGRTGVGLPESVQGLSELRGEDGRVYLRLGIGVHRDIIKEIGYESDPEIPADLAAAMA